MTIDQSNHVPRKNNIANSKQHLQSPHNSFHPGLTTSGAGAKCGTSRAGQGVGSARRSTSHQTSLATGEPRVGSPVARLWARGFCSMMRRCSTLEELVKLKEIYEVYLTTWD